MNSFKTLALALALSSTSVAFADLAGDKTAVDEACKAEAATAGCGADKVGSGLLKCIHAYRKDHKDFKVSDGCKNARMALRGDRKMQAGGAKAAK